MVGVIYRWEMPFGKWKNFEDCVRDFVSQGKDEESAKKICGALQARLGKEFFGWTGEIKAYEKNLIRGKALHPIKTVHPEEWPGVRVYLEEELQKAAHTLEGAPLILDHLYPINGKVLVTTYEDGAVEYIAELNDEQVLGWIRDGSIKHCSVEYDWSSLEKVDGVAPRGIQFKGLALLKNFEAGDPASSVEIWNQIVEAIKEAKRLTPLNPDQAKGSETVKKLSKVLSERVEVPESEIGEVPDVPEQLNIGPEPSLDEVIQAVEDALEEVNNAIEQINANFQALQPQLEEAKKIESLENRLTIVTDQNKALEEALRFTEEKIKGLERDKAELTKRLGEAVIEPRDQQEKFKQTVLRELKAAVFERVPHHWGYGPYEQNRRIKEIIKRLEK